MGRWKKYEHITLYANIYISCDTHTNILIHTPKRVCIEFGCCHSDRLLSPHISLWVGKKILEYFVDSLL